MFSILHQKSEDIGLAYATIAIRIQIVEDKSKDLLSRESAEVYQAYNQLLERYLILHLFIDQFEKSIAEWSYNRVLSFADVH